MTMSRLEDLLNGAGLGQYAPKFREKDVTETSLINLSMQDYANLGVFSLPDRKKLFQLIQMLKREQESGGGSASSSSSNTTAASAPATTVVSSSGATKAAPQSNIPPPRQEPPTQLPQPRGANPPKGPRNSVAPQPPAVQQDQNLNALDDEFYRQRPRTAPSNDDAVVFNDDDPAFNAKIRVCVRKRPLLKKEINKKDGDVIKVESRNSLIVNEPKVKVDLTKFTERHLFHFDEVFKHTENNVEVYRRTARPLIDYIFQKGKATCFAYGQTGSGKTHTMMGVKDGPPGTQGIYMLASVDIFTKLKQYPNLNAYCSFFEIYGGKLFDLLNDRKQLFAREDAKQQVVVCGLQEHQVDNTDNLIRILGYGNSVRSTGSTSANADSSRSHAVLQITLKEKAKPQKMHGKISFVDLAGSERGADTMDGDRQTRIEGAEINKSLLALKECIRALDQDHRHTPFRGSKLTMVLRDSFIGNARTVMIANISPSLLNCEHTLNTLRYSDRVKELRSAPDGGVEPTPQMVRRPSNPSMVAEYPARGNQKQAAQQQKPTAAPQQQQRPSQIQSTEIPEPQGDDLDVSDEMKAISHHEDLINKILGEEEETIAAHREQIDEIMELVKDEMRLLNEVDQPGSAIDEYVGNLDKILLKKIDVISNLRSKLSVFQAHLKEEEKLRDSFKSHWM
eukprot:GFYU01000365.1.p1 GENE.GFYU01000365.1~~GFYU01000365.1.p1  ORF type:complete len:678 (-),score=167.41 GFYU01000365.1:281-2314(-)